MSYRKGAPDNTTLILVLCKWNKTSPIQCCHISKVRGTLRDFSAPVLGRIERQIKYTLKEGSFSSNQNPDNKHIFSTCSNFSKKKKKEGEIPAETCVSYTKIKLQGKS